MYILLFYVDIQTVFGFIKPLSPYACLPNQHLLFPKRLPSSEKHHRPKLAGRGPRVRPTRRVAAHGRLGTGPTPALKTASTQDVAPTSTGAGTCAVFVRLGTRRPTRGAAAVADAASSAALVLGRQQGPTRHAPPTATPFVDSRPTRLRPRAPAPVSTGLVDGGRPVPAAPRSGYVL